MKQMYSKEKVIELLTQNLTQEQCESIISIWSVRPAPMSSEGKAWEDGAVWGWLKCLNNAKYLLEQDKKD